MQVFKLLDRDQTVVEFNSRWLVPLGAEGTLAIRQAKIALAQHIVAGLHSRAAASAATKAFEAH